MHSVDKILASIREKYGSLEKPNFSFVHETVRRNPYSGLIRELSKTYSILEDTDENDDVSFGFNLQRGNELRGLRISMVGNYFLLLRAGDDGSYSLVEPSAQLSSSDQRLIELLSQANLQMLDEQTLLLPVPLALFNTEPGNSRVYQALFTDNDQIPWTSPAVSVLRRRNP